MSRRLFTPLVTAARTVRRRAGPPPPGGILDEGATFSDISSVITNPTTRLPYPEESIREHLEKTSRELLKEKRKAVFGTKKRKTADIDFSHIPIEEQVVLLFPGQGAQKVGMGTKLLDCPAAKETYEKANEILGYDLLKLCSEGPSSKLCQTIYCQPAVFVSSIAALEKLKASEPSIVDNITDVAGFSVGEFSAMVAGGMLRFEDALRLVKIRAEAMHECNQLVSSGMATVRVKASSRLAEALQDAREQARLAGEMEIAEVANYLFCGTRVVGATKVGLDFLEKHQEDYGIQVLKRLDVSGAFHTRQMAEAVPRVKEALGKAELLQPTANVYSNYSGHVFPAKKAEIRQAIANQVNHPVKWEQILQVLLRKNVDLRFPRFIEVGPGRQLGAMVLATSKKMYKSYEHVDC